ncbi:uncharacterized protein dbf4b [Syngnathoides biaculeatus]|uniref:uncharacterized protein dbf4b n=1 Tax=Syngnathoides biaculeatus TaxID=300417 RepID=UPI002ADD6B23|nr:uncharacterized protein dbf4b [Syngnathoides biaculeatus]
MLPPHQQCKEQPGLLGKLCPGEKKLQGKTFYLDNVKKRPTALLLEAISVLGGGVESFLHRDVSFVVTGSQEELEEKRPAGIKTCDKSHQPVKQRESIPEGSKQGPATPRPVACGSRGKALLEKAIRNNERLQGSSVLANARSWGVSIVHVDDVVLYLKKLTGERGFAKPSRHERTSTQHQSCRHVKAAPLRSPFLKIEDISRKYKPLHMQSMSFPSLCPSGRFSPFESPPPRFVKTPQRENKSRPKGKVQNSSRDKSRTVSLWPPRKKGISYCECCLQSFTNLDEHLQSDQHRAFVLETSNYGALERLALKMVPSFELDPSEEVVNRHPAGLPTPSNCELEVLTDAEIELEVQALQGQSSCSRPAPDPPESPEEPEHIPSADTQCPEPESLLHTSAAPLCVSDNFPQVHFPARLQPPPLSLKPTAQDLDFDIYGPPPVLSPQVFISGDVEPFILYSEPPDLEPQNYTTEDCDYDAETGASVSDALPTSHLAHPSVAVSIAEEAKGSRQERVSSEPSIPFLQARPSSLNLKKRRRHSSCEHDREKRRRAAADEFAESEIRCCISKRTPVQLVLSKENTSQIDRVCSPAGDRLDFSPFNRLETTWSPASKFPSPRCPALSSQDSQQCASLCIDPALIPDVARLSSSESDWDCDLLSRLGPAQTGSGPDEPAAAAAGDLDTEFLHRPCTWMKDTGYESRLHTALQPSTTAGEPLAFSRTVVQIVEVLH